MSGGGSSAIFRQAALDRLSNPEQLDRIMTVARPGDWLAFAALLAVVLTAIGWSVLGSMATRVSGSGILVAQGGAIFSPVANGDGLVMEMKATPGQQVAAGERLARIAQPDLEEQLASARAVVDEYQAQFAALHGQVGSYAAARARNGAAQRRLLAQQRTDAEAKAADLAAQLQAAQGLFQRGIVTRGKVSDLTQQLAVARQGVTEAGSRLVQIDADEISTMNGDDRDVRAAESRLSEARRRLRDIAADLDRKQWVTSPAAGHVVEIRTPVGSRVSAGVPVLSIENGAAALQLILYVPPRDGKRVRTGMRVNVSPSVARREEFGTITGRVVEVSDFPATQQAMAATLQNDQLVKDFSGSGAPIVARIALDRSRRTATGYAWAGGGGPDVPLTSGTIAEADITVERQAPITFALPFLRGAVGM